MYGHMCTLLCEGQRTILGATPQMTPLPSCLFETGLLTGLKLPFLARLAAGRAPEIGLFLPQCQDPVTPSFSLLFVFSMGSEN